MKRILIVIFLFCSSFIMAQQTPLVSHYMFNGLVLNPAYAGSKEFVSTTMMYRKQWVGFEGAPVTYSGSVHGLLPKKKLGMGAFIQKDNIGKTNQTDVYVSTAYHLPLGDVSKLSIGLQLGATNFSSNVVELTYWDPGDKIFDYNTFTTFLPNAGFGAYFYRPLFYAGLSVPYLVNYKPSENNEEETTQIHHLGRRMYLTVGGVIETEGDVKIKPSLLIKKEGATAMQYDLNVNVLFNEIFWVGASYRSNEAVVALFEYQINRKFRVGYSYDITMGGISNYNSGSHELMLGYDFGYPVLKIKSPRYF